MFNRAQKEKNSRLIDLLADGNCISQYMPVYERYFTLTLERLRRIQTPHYTEEGGNHFAGIRNLSALAQAIASINTAHDIFARILGEGTTDSGPAPRPDPDNNEGRYIASLIRSFGDLISPLQREEIVNIIISKVAEVVNGRFGMHDLIIMCNGLSRGLSSNSIESSKAASILNDEYPANYDSRHHCRHAYNTLQGFVYNS